MTAGLIFSVILGAGIAAFMIAPLLRADAAEAERVASAESEVRDLTSRREMLLASLKDLDDDHATNKLSEEDYQQLYGRLSAEAVEVMKRLDALAEATPFTQRPRSDSNPAGPPA